MRYLFIGVALFVIGLVGEFLFYVSVLSIMATVAVVTGLVAALVLGYYAGINSAASVAEDDQVYEPTEILPPSKAPEPDAQIHIVRG